MDQNEAQLQEELARLTEKLPSADDPDIRNALQARIEEIQARLKANISQQAENPLAYEQPGFAERQAEIKDDLQSLETNLVTQAEIIRLQPGTPEETAARAELTKVSRQLYTADDPAVRTQLQARVTELQGMLGIDVAKLGSSEMSATAVPDLSVAAKPGKKKEETKGRTNLADLQALVAEKSAQIRRPTDIPTEIDVPENFEPATPAQIEAAEKLIQQARVETMRNNRVRAQELLEEAARVAPGSSSVQEMLGDDYASRKISMKAMQAYRRAVKLDPKNVNAERKLAQLALGSGGSIQSGFGGLSDSAVPMASQRAALLISIFLPGLGHIVLGRAVKGWTILSIWLVCTIWLILGGGDIAKVFAGFNGGHTHGNMIILLPMVVMLVLFVMTLADFKNPQETARRPVDRPTPPVNLPFE